MRDAFGVQDRVRYSGIIEVLGPPTRPRLKNAAHIDPSEASGDPSPEETIANVPMARALRRPASFTRVRLAAPGSAGDAEITEASKHIMLEETKQGLNIEIV